MLCNQLQRKALNSHTDQHFSLFSTVFPRLQVLVCLNLLYKFKNHLDYQKKTDMTCGHLRALYKTEESKKELKTHKNIKVNSALISIQGIVFISKQYFLNFIVWTWWYSWIMCGYVMQLTEHSPGLMTLKHFFTFSLMLF